MHKIELALPRDDEKRFCDLLHLNGFKTEVERPEGRPVVVRICIEAHQFEGDVVPAVHGLGARSSIAC